MICEGSSVAGCVAWLGLGGVAAGSVDGCLDVRHVSPVVASSAVAGDTCRMSGCLSAGLAAALFGPGRVVHFAAELFLWIVHTLFL